MPYQPVRLCDVKNDRTAAVMAETVRKGNPKTLSGYTKLCFGRRGTMPEMNRENKSSRNDRLLAFDLTTELRHGMAVSNLSFDVAGDYGLPPEECYELAIAGMMHDIGKLRLKGYILGQEKDPLVIEELKFVRMHSMLGYEELKSQNRYSDFILESILYHHENYDGSGYPSHLHGEEIPIGARILRVCDVYCALTSDRPYRKAFDPGSAVELMIEEIKNFDLGVFLSFQRVIHKDPEHYDTGRNLPRNRSTHENITDAEAAE